MLTQSYPSQTTQGSETCSPSPIRDLRVADPSPSRPAPTKATTTEARHANWAAEPGAGDTYCTEAASANRPPSEAANRSASEAAPTNAAAEAGPDRSATETTTTYRPSPKATTDCTPAETATHRPTPETAAHPAAVEASNPTAAHSSTAALGRSHVGKESGRDQRCRAEKTKLIHGHLLTHVCNASLEITLSASTVNRV